jgi:hypothetical protein
LVSQPDWSCERTSAAALLALRGEGADLRGVRVVAFEEVGVDRCGEGRIVVRNDAKSTFEWLDRAWSNRDTGIGSLLFDPFILRYKDDPRFAAFCRKVGLPVPGETSARKST